MHIFIGMINIFLGHYLTSLYLTSRRDTIGGMAVRRCCSAFSAGSGLDDAAIRELIRMGQDGVRLLKLESEQSWNPWVVQQILRILEEYTPPQGQSGDRKISRN
jgi:hypothetical protein